jgi:hypothetical protein
MTRLRPILAVLLLATGLPPAGAGAQSSAAPPPPPTPPPAAPGLLAIPKLEVAGPFESKIRLEITNRIRGEFVDWFARPDTSATPDNQYDFLGNKFQAGIRVTRDPVELFVQFQDTTVTNLPTRGLGVGATYYANTAYSPQNGTFVRNAWLKWKSPFGLEGLSVTGGRQLYSDAMDAPAKDPTLLWVQTNRIGQRLLGPFDYTHTGRSFDGGRIGFDAADWNVTAFGFRPTRGGFEVNANGEVDITVAGASLYLKDSPAVAASVGKTIGRLFYMFYGDDRNVLFLDNRPLARRRADLGRYAYLHTIGGNAVHVEPLGPGNVDAMAYGMVQVGNWQSQNQSAYAWGTELGYQLPDVWAKPWLRLGFNLGSGDKDPTDNTHGTFFQMLPTAWLYAQFPFYNMMNNQDAFAQLVLQPHPRVTLRWDMLHWLRTTSSLDLAYFGGGATKNSFFGYGSTGTPRGGSSSLALLTHLLLSVKPIDPLTVNFFYAHAWGQSVISANYSGTPANYGFVEMILSF